MKIYDMEDNELLDVEVDDSSYRYRAIRQGDKVYLYYALTRHVELPVGSHIEYQGRRYTLWRPEDLTKRGTRNIEYTLALGGDWELLGTTKYKHLSAIPHRLRFSLTGKPRLFLQLLVDNMNLFDSGWEVGSCIDAPERTLAFNHEYCLPALNRMADEWDTEFEIDGKTIHFGKVERFKDNPLPLAYGRGNGFKPGVGRAKRGDRQPVSILYVQGGERNIDPATYGSRTLLLPKSQELEYEGRRYRVDRDGMYVTRADRELLNHNEDSLDASSIYPSRVGTVSAVEVVDQEGHLYDIMDDSIPDSLDYSGRRIEGERATMIFQSGILTGEEFEIEQTDTELTGYVHAERRFKLVPVEKDGGVIPNPNRAPAPGDKYAVFNISLPAAYVRDDETRTGASWDMFREAARCLYGREEETFSFTGELDGIWSRSRWLEVGGYMRPGAYILFSDPQFQPDGIRIRVVGVKDYINRPYSPELELSNMPVPGFVSSELAKIDANEVREDERRREMLHYTRRRWRDAIEAQEMLARAFGDYSRGIDPIWVRTLSLLVGDESLQFRFVDSRTDPHPVGPDFAFDDATGVLTAPGSILQHMTLGISEIKGKHTPDEYRYWDMPEYVSPPLGEFGRLYLYAVCPNDGKPGRYLLTEEPHGLEEDGDYNFLVGLLGSQSDGSRSFVSVYGFSEVLPGRITTDRIVSNDGMNFLDLVNNAFRVGNAGGYLDWNTRGDSKLRIRGTIVQSDSGDESPIGCFRGAYNPSYTYYEGDEVTYTADGLTSTYRYMGKSPAKGTNPTNTKLWAPVAKGSRGEDGADGRYTEIRYAKNGSSSYPPELDNISMNPPGWDTAMPSTGTAEFLWMTSAVKTGDGRFLIRSWSAPARITPRDGQDGRQGLSPAMVYRGIYDPAKEYYGNAYRLDCVRYGSSWYIARTDAGRFSGVTPTNGTRWNPFGASFDSVATSLLLAENANIAGWIFRNNRLESEAGNVYLDGKRGEMRLKGTLQLSTGYDGNFSDVNLFYLPATSYEKRISMGSEPEDIGKVVRLFNSSPYGGGDYLITMNEFYGERNYSFSANSVYARVRPQEVVEMSCFERPKDGHDYHGEWMITSRFGTTDFVNSGAKGRFPLVIAIGSVEWAEGSMAIWGRFHDGRSAESVLRGSRLGEGQYRISFSPSEIPDGYTVMLTGYGAVAGTTGCPAKGALANKRTDSFEIWISDDSTRNDGRCEFIIFAPEWEYNMR